MMKSSLLLIALLSVFASESYTQTFMPQLGQQSLSNSSYIIDKDGKLWAWGANESGQLGIGNTTDQNAPVQVSKPLGVTGWVHIAAGERHAVAVGDSDKLFTWGYNREAELGTGTTTNRSSPARITNPPGVTSWRAVSAGEDHTLALSSSGVLYGWGNNDRGQLGTSDGGVHGTSTIIPMPSGVSRWSSIAAGAGFSIAVTDRGDLYAWGYDSSGAWGDIGINAPHLISRDMAKEGWLPVLSAGRRAILALTRYGTSFTPGFTTTESGKIAVATGGAHRMYLDASGKLAFRGENYFGQIGTPDPFATSASIQFPPRVSQWVAIAGGANHTLALGNDGNLYAWGDNSRGQLGSARQDSTWKPEIVRSFTDSLGVSATLRTSNDGGRLTETVTIHATTKGVVTAPVAVLTTAEPVDVVGNHLAPLVPANLSTGDSASATWSLRVDSSLNFQGYASTYAYVVAASGTSPVIVSTGANVTVHRLPQYVVTRVVDTLTGAAIAGAVVSDENGHKDTTDINGQFTRVSTEVLMIVYVTAENHRSKRINTALSEPPDTAFVTISLAPAPLVGTLRSAGAHFDVVGIADNSDVWGAIGKTLWRSDDGGKTSTFVQELSDTIASIAFADSLHGYLVGRKGLIDRINVQTHECTAVPEAVASVNLNAIACASGTVWIAGDSGVVLRRLASGVWTKEIAHVGNMHQVSAFDRDHAAMLGDSGVSYRNVAGWVNLNTRGEGITAIDLVEPDLLYVASSTGHFYYLYPSSPSLVPNYIGPIGPVRRLHFLNSQVGLGSDVTGLTVTYDGGGSWAPIQGVSSVTNVALMGLSAVVATTSGSARYDMQAGPLDPAIYGRVFEPNGVTGTSGAKLSLDADDGSRYAAYTHDQGYYVLSDVGLGANLGLEVSAVDSLGTWSRRDTVSLSPGETVRHDFIRSKAGVSEEYTLASQIGLTCTARSGRVRFGLQGASQAIVTVYDAIGREVLQPTEIYSGRDVQCELPRGCYYARAVTPNDRSAVIRAFIVR